MASSSGGIDHTVPEEVRRLVAFITGCRDDVDGISAKITLVRSFIAAQKGRADLMDVMCWLHLQKAVTISAPPLLRAVTWQRGNGPRPGADTTQAAVHDADHPGLYVASALEACESVNDMRSVVDRYVASNKNVNVVDVMRYVNWRGFVKVDASALLAANAPLTYAPKVVDWRKPPEELVKVPNWRLMWQAWEDEYEYDEPRFPGGAPTYVSLRDMRGRPFKMAFLGSIDGQNPGMRKPGDVLCGPVWRLPRPRMCIASDAGSMHPRQCDSINMMCHLPQHKEWIDTALADRRLENQQAGAADIEQPKTTPGKKAVRKRRPDLGALDHEERPTVDVNAVMRKSIADWQQELQTMDTDLVIGDGSINNLIYTKLKEMFSSLLDAAKLAGSWVIIDRTDGQGSATAEVLIELALERGAQRPTIVAIDSLERLGKAHDNSCSHKMLNQLFKVFHDGENATQKPNGSEKELTLDFLHSLEEFDRAQSYTGIPDQQLPFDLLPEHATKQFGNTCEPNRKWRYFYVDGLYANATHYIIKNNDADEFDIERFARMGFVYAHGDTRTYKRLRSNIQQGKSIVLLHNSGSVVTAFSWLQRVMAFSRPAPSPEALRGPLKFLIANLSRANWTEDFGMPEVIMMKGLADRAPFLFRKNVISIDIMADSEEQSLKMITGCFAEEGGVPELGQGNAETIVVFNAWSLHLMLCENASSYWLKSVITQCIVWTLALLTTSIAIFIGSLGGQGDPAGAVMQRYLNLTADETSAIVQPLGNIALLLPIASALSTTMASKMGYRDKWSVCYMTATQIVAEIYKFRMMTLEYDNSIRPQTVVEGTEPEPALTEKEMKRLARVEFVERIKAFYTSSVRELSQDSGIQRRRAPVHATEQHMYRLNQELKPTLAQWLKLKKHAEGHYYQTKWEFPSASFLNWISGLQPSMHQRVMRSELSVVMEDLVASGKLKLEGKPLANKQVNQVQTALVAKLRLPPKSLDRQKDEIQQLMREIAVILRKEQLEDSIADVALESFTNKKKGARKDQVAPKALSPKKRAAKAAALLEDEEEIFYDGASAMRKHLMALQGMQYGKLSVKDKKAEKRKEQKQSESVVDDDFLLGTLGTESYVTFRVRPLIEHYEKKAVLLANRLILCETLSIVFQASGVVLALLNCQEWVTLAIAVVAVVMGIQEFTQLRNQVVSVNLSLRDLQKLIVWWDSLSVLRRRSDDTKARVVGTTERAIFQVVDEHTTSAASAQLSVEKDLAGRLMEEDVSS